MYSSKIPLLLDQAYGNRNYCFQNVKELIAFCGCKLFLFDKRPSEKALGNPPNGSVFLSENKIIYGHKESMMEVGCYASHEAIHSYVGTASFKEEGMMMGLEWALYNNVSNDTQRYALLDFFSESYDEKDAIGRGLWNNKEKYFQTSEWTRLIDMGIENKFLIASDNLGGAVLDPKLLP